MRGYRGCDMGQAMLYKKRMKGAKGAKSQSIRKLFETDAACEDLAGGATLLPAAGASARQRIKKGRICASKLPLLPLKKAEAVNCRSEARHTLGERKALLMALLSKVLLRYF